MDYKEQIERAKRASEKWRKKHKIVGVGELRVDLMVDDLTRSITDLLTRAEAAEAELAALRRLQPVQLDDAGANVLALAAEVSELHPERGTKQKATRWNGGGGDWEYHG